MEAALSVGTTAGHLSLLGSMKWYVLSTRPHHEQAVYERLLNAGFESFLPLAMVRRQSKAGLRKASTPLFPRHLFVRCCLEIYTHIEVITTPGVMQLLDDGHGQFLVVPDEEIRTLRQLCEAEIPSEKGAYQMGELVKVVDGALAGITGVIRKGRPRKLLIPIHTLRQSVAVPIGGVCVIPVADVQEGSR